MVREEILKSSSLIHFIFFLYPFYYISFPGYYHMPEYSSTRLQITGRVDPVILPVVNRSSGTSNATLKPMSSFSVDAQGGTGGMVRYVMGDNVGLKLFMAFIVIAMGVMFVFIMNEVNHIPITYS